VCRHLVPIAVRRANTIGAVSLSVRDRLRAALSAALEQRDAPLVAVLRATLAALDNAHAVPIPDHDHGSLALEQTLIGVGAREAARRDLSDGEVERLVRAEIEERQSAARVYERAGQHERAGQLCHEADRLAAVTGLSPLSRPDS
jgi:uncharacterized protein